MLFVILLVGLKNKRVEVKHSDEDTVDGIDRDTLALVFKRLLLILFMVNLDLKMVIFMID